MVCTCFISFNRAPGMTLSELVFCEMVSVQEEKCLSSCQVPIQLLNVRGCSFLFQILAGRKFEQLLAKQICCICLKYHHT